MDYVIKNGFIEDNRILTEDPFRQVGSIIDIFENDIDTRTKLIQTINEIKINAGSTENGVPFGLFNEETETYNVEELDNYNEPDDELPF